MVVVVVVDAVVDDNEEEDHVAKGAGALYEKIAKVYLSDKKIQKEPEREPLTGFSPYEWLVEKHEEAYRSGDNTIQFYNESERDVVVFIDHGDNLALQAGIYVRAKGMISNWRGSGSVYTVSVYAGEYWQDSIAEYKGRALPGFRIPHKFIGGKKKGKAFESPTNTLWLVGKEGEVQSLLYTEDRFEVQKK